MRNAWAVVLFALMVAALGPVAAPVIGAGPGSRGDEIIPDDLIPISETGTGSGKWDGPDLSIEYWYRIDRGGITVTGTFDFIESLKYGSSLVNYLNLGIIFGDAGGRALASGNLLTTRLSAFDLHSGTKFSRRIALPPGTATFAFTYDGEVMRLGGGHRGGGGANPTRFWHIPTAGAGSIPR